MGTETEIKLEGETALLDRHPLLLQAETRRRMLRSVYFDAGGRLRRHGIALRVRDDGADFTQTVKSGHGLVERSEWEKRVASLAPDQTLLADTPAGDVLKRGDLLQPLFSVNVDRRMFLLTQGRSRIEVALDRGDIVVTEDETHTSPIDEVELELKDGRAEDLFDLARQLAAGATLKVGVRSKAERGFRLVAGENDKRAKAEPIALDGSLTVADAFRAIAESCLRQLRLNEDRLMHRRDDEALHQMRVGVRRLRSAASLFGDILADDESRALRDDLKRLTEPLGRARNLDVLLSQTLGSIQAERPDELDLLNLEKAFAQQRAEAYAGVDALLRSTEWNRLVIDIYAWLHAGARREPTTSEDRRLLDLPVHAFAEGELEHRLRQVRKRGRHLADTTDAKRHKLRIAAKKLRYGAEFFAGLYPERKATKRHSAFVAALKRLQDALGDLNDIATAKELFEGQQTASSASVVFAAGLGSGHVDRDRHPLLQRAEDAHEQLMLAKPFWN